MAENLPIIEACFLELRILENSVKTVERCWTLRLELPERLAAFMNGKGRSASDKNDF